MKIELKVNASKCIGCGRCIRVCPSRIFLWNGNDPDGKQKIAGVQNIETCIACGHCAAVCPAGAVEHSLFPPEKIHAIEYAQMPTPEQVLLLCKARRTNRAFKKDPVPQEHIRLILEAAHRAPTASNSQNVAFTVITSPEKIREINLFVIEMFGGMIKKMENPLLKPLLKLVMGGAYRYVPLFYRMKDEFAKGNDLILRGATAVIFLHTPKENRFGEADANLAYENGSLMAESLGVSQLYTGFVCTAVKMGKGRFEKLIGLAEGRVIQAGMGLGMPEFRYPNYIDKKELIFNEIK